MAKISYSENFRELIEERESSYKIFKEHYELLADSFKFSSSNRLTLDQIEGLVLQQEDERLSDLTSDDLRRDVVEITADIYDELGIISSKTRKYPTDEEPVKIYQIPSYHGKGGSASWKDIKEDLERSINEAEKILETESTKAERKYKRFEAI